jgi:hypothetical protein
MSEPKRKAKRKKMGRPITIGGELIGIRLPDRQLDAVDEWAFGMRLSRSAAIRSLIDRGLEAIAADRKRRRTPKAK